MKRWITFDCIKSIVPYVPAPGGSEILWNEARGLDGELSLPDSEPSRCVQEDPVPRFRTHADPDKAMVALREELAQQALAKGLPAIAAQLMAGLVEA